MSAQTDCPICMDLIEFNKNCVTTDCGHCFHASCLMQSVAHNGFGCPYCRTKMAEQPDDESTIYTEDEEDEEVELFDDNALRGFRFFFNRIDGNENDAEDIEDEEQAEQSDEDDEQEEDTNVPSVDFVAQKLRQEGVTYEQLLTLLLTRDHDEYRDSEQIERMDDELFGKIRIIVSNYEPQQAAENSQATNDNIQSPIERQVGGERIVQPVGQDVDFEAQPKVSVNLRTPRFMIHV